MITVPLIKFLKSESVCVPTLFILVFFWLFWVSYISVYTLVTACQFLHKSYLSFDRDYSEVVNQFGEYCILTTVILSIHEHGLFFPLFRSFIFSTMVYNFQGKHLMIILLSLFLSFNLFGTIASEITF